MFDVGDRLDGLRCWPTERLVARRDELVREQRRLRVEELAVGARPRGRPWDSREHRSADALVDLCDRYETADGPAAAAKPLLVVEVPMTGPAELAGIPLTDAMVEQLRAGARIEPVLVDGDGVADAVGARSTVLSAKIARAVLVRDGHCRIPGCEIRHGLEIHHLRPRSWGGTDDLANLAAVCRAGGHHALLVPTGKWALVGNPNRPDGLRLVRVDELTDDQATQLGRPPPRAEPAARARADVDRLPTNR
jgi:HNH endonuclease